MIYESVTIDSKLSSLTLSIGDPVLAIGVANIESMMDGFSCSLQAGRVDVGFLGGAQIDRRATIYQSKDMGVRYFPA